MNDSDNDNDSDNKGMFPDPTRLQLQSELWKASAAWWRQSLYTAQRGALYAAVPGLLLAVAALLGDRMPAWGINVLAGCTLITSTSVILNALILLCRERRDHKIDQAMTEMFFDDKEGK